MILYPMKKTLAAIATLLFLSMGTASISRAAGFAVKLATLVPERSVWGTPIKEMGEGWKKATEGRVFLRMYPNGIAGDDPDMVRKMRIGQLHAATLTVSGLAEIDSAFAVFEIPMFFDSYEELFYIIDKMEPYLIERLESKGYKLIHWGHAGWVYLFSTTPVSTIGDLQKLKFFVWAGNDELVTWWKENGFRPVPLAATDIMTGMQTGMFEAMPSTPLASLSLQWYRGMPYMLDLGFAPLVGATVMTKRAWNRISEEDRPRILEIGQAAADRLSKEIPDQEEVAVREMEKRGLSVTRVVGTADEAGWHEAAQKFAINMREAFVPEEAFRRALEARAEFRARSD